MHIIQEQNHYESQIKVLYKKFRILDKPNTKILYEFCQFDSIKTYKILSLAKTMRNPTTIIQILIKNPEKSEQYIDSLIGRYDKEIGQQIDLNIQKSQNNKITKQITRLDFQFFNQVPQDTILTIMSYLDPYSFIKLTFSNSTFYKISQSPCISQLFKQICISLFSLSQPKLPLQCRFSCIKQFVQTHPQQYYPYYQNFKNAVNNNLRLYIWKNQPSQLKLNKDYYLSYGSYYNLFQKCPRIHYNGYYICKHKYVKIGEKNSIHSITPIHLIYYYRYLRFLEDGSVVYYICNRKIKQQDIIKHLSIKHLNQQPSNSMIGQYMQYKQMAYVKTCKENTVFCYQFLIRSTEGKISNQLVAMEYKLELIDKSYITQTLYKSHPNKEQLMFQYVFNQDIKKENNNRIQACSL